MNQQATQATEQSLPTQGPGDKLQAARISKGLSLDEVASKMHLSKAILSSLEDNSFEEITAPIFVKGYLRAYSRLVNIDEDEIIQQYTTHYMEGDPPITSTSNTAPELNADNSKVKWITYLVIIGLIALLSSWWWNRYQQEPETVSLDSSQPSLTEDIKISEANEATDNLEANPEKEALQLEIKTVADSIQLQSPDSEKVAESHNVPINSQTEQLSVSEANTDEADTEEVSAEIDQPASAPQIDSVKNNKDLQITVNADTWATIKDADGKRLVYDLLKSGEQISVQGKAPYKAFLGNGYGVTMIYKGEKIDLSKVIRSDNTARIKIGQ